MFFDIIVITMEINFKREFKKRKFRLAVLPHGDEVSRGEIAAKTGLNLQTIAAYAEEYKKLGFLTERTASEGRGRPVIYYRSNINNVCFLGISMIYNEISLMLMNVNSLIIGTKLVRVDASLSDFTAYLTGCIDELLATHSDKKLAGTGFCLNEYKQDKKLARGFKKLFSAVKSKYMVVSALVNSDTAVLNALSYHLKPSGNLAMIQASDEIRMGLMLDGVPVWDTGKWEKRLAHTTVVENGEPCNCGRKGCLCRYLTHSAICERYCRRAAFHGDFDIYNFRILLAGHDPICMEIARENGEMMGRALAKLSKEIHFSRIYLYTADDIMTKAALESFRSLTKSTDTVIEPYWYFLSDVCTASAQLCLSGFFR
ncbi:MAG: hypothetical protein A2017_09695 [Lentisphaerae bacterium GWF2_44_16]|nr:MAG: hypothetical protein A2017_09695 [Lentisphaerae bacterium GWF2_44_16]